MSALVLETTVDSWAIIQLSSLMPRTSLVAMKNATRRTYPCLAMLPVSGYLSLRQPHTNTDSHPFRMVICGIEGLRLSL